MEVVKTTGNRALDEELNRMLARIKVVEKGGIPSASIVPSSTIPAAASASSIPLAPFDNGNSAAGTVTFNFSFSNNQVLTLTGNPTLAFNGLTAGYTYAVKLIQDSGGPRTVTWPGSGLAWQGGSAPTLSITAGKADLLGFYYDGATMVGYVIAQGF